MSTTTNEQQKGQSKPEMTKMAYDFMANCYIYACQLRAKGHHTLAERLVTQALELDYEANFIKGAFSTPEFMKRMLRSSVVTMMNREKSGGSSKASDSPVVKSYEKQEKHEYTEPHRTDGDAGSEDKAADEDGSGDVLDEFEDSDASGEAEPSAVSA